MLVALTATEFPAGPSVSTRFAACHIEWFPTRFPRCHGFEGSASPMLSPEVQKLTSNPRNSPSVPGPLHVQPKNGATKLPLCGASIVGIEAVAFMELCYARSQSMRIHSSRKKIPELVSSVRTKAGPIEVTDPARRERDLLAKIIQLGRHFLSTDASYNLSVQKGVPKNFRSQALAVVNSMALPITCISSHRWEIATKPSNESPKCRLD